MKPTLKTAIAATLALTALCIAPAPPVIAQEEPLKVAMGDIASVESLGLLIAMERAEENGVPMEITFFNSEDVAVQAVAGGQVDIGVGAPYAFVQNSNAPIRMFYRLSTLLFFPVVNSEVYSDWSDLDGEEVTVHSRGSGTEALMRLMEQVHGIKYANISYVPGSEVRAGAMLKGTINASIVDAAAFGLLQREGGGKFKRLPIEGVDATDEALFANTDSLKERGEDVAIFVDALAQTWAEINEDPTVVARLRETYDLLPDLPAEAVAGITDYYADAVAGGIFPTEQMTAEDVRADLDFLAAAGQVDAPDESFDPGRFWVLELGQSVN